MNIFHQEYYYVKDLNRYYTNGILMYSYKKWYFIYLFNNLQIQLNFGHFTLDNNNNTMGKGFWKESALDLFKVPSQNLLGVTEGN